MQILGPAELSNRILARDLCTLCGACADLCPYVKSHEGKIAHLFSCDKESGRCYAACPKTGMDEETLSRHFFKKSLQEGPLGHYMSIHMAKIGPRAKKERKAQGKGFQNGGTVSALVIAALEMGMIQSAILTGGHGIIPDPRRVTTPQEVMECTSSRYIAAPTMAKFNQAASQGHENLGFVGTPCQMTGLANLRTNPLELPDFKDPTGIAIGLFCTWALKRDDFLSYLKEKKIDPAQIFSMDIPPPPAKNAVLAVKDLEASANLDNPAVQSHKDMHIPLDDLRKLVLPGCAICADMTSLFCDLSVGALEENPQWNTLIVRTEKGKKLVDYAVENGFLNIDSISSTSQDGLTLAALNKKNRAVETQKRMGMLDPEFQRPLKTEPKKTIMGFR